MRQLFIGIVVMVICGKGFSQVHEQVYDNMPMYTIIGDSIYRDSGQNLYAYPRGRFIENTVPSPPADTIPCLMLVSDTSTYDNKTLAPYAEWIKGYEVMETQQGGGTIIFFHAPTYYHIQYLDKNKFRLPERTIVWISKQTN